jgi:hypothetical protein
VRTIDSDGQSDDSPPAPRPVETDTPGRADRLGARLAALRRPGLSNPVWVDAVVPTLLIHAVLLVFAIAAVIVFYPNDLQGTDGLRMWNHWDGPHFLELAARGYWSADPARIVLFPLYPLLIAIVSWVVSPLVGAMALALAFSLLAAGGLYLLVQLDTDRETARLSVIAMNLFPTAFVFIAPYSESLFLALVVWSFLFARRGNWAGAGLAGALAGATRLQGAFLIPALAVEYLVQKRVLQTRRLDLDAIWCFFSRASRLSYAVYTLLTLVSFLTLNWPISVPRYILGVFPVFILGGRLGRRPWLGSPLFAASVLLLGLFTTLFVIGHWAF